MTIHGSWEKQTTVMHLSKLYIFYLLYVTVYMHIYMVQDVILQVIICLVLFP